MQKISPFEATLIGILAHKPASRYDVMMIIQRQSLLLGRKPWGGLFSPWPFAREGNSARSRVYRAEDS